MKNIITKYIGKDLFIFIKIILIYLYCNNVFLNLSKHKNKMGYEHFFHFIKDELIDPIDAFKQNVDNFLFTIYFGFLERYSSDIKKERNRLLSILFGNIKKTLMVMSIDYNEDNEYLGRYGYLDDFIDLKFKMKKMVYAEMQVYLMLYCIFVNGLNKIKDVRFNGIKKEFEPLTKILKNIFCEFDKNEIHKEMTFIFPLRLPNGEYTSMYIINNDDLIIKYEDDNRLISLFLHENTIKNKVDKRKFKYYSIVLDESLHGEEVEYQL